MTDSGSGNVICPSCGQKNPAELSVCSNCRILLREEPKKQNKDTGSFSSVRAILVLAILLANSVLQYFYFGDVADPIGSAKRSLILTVVFALFSGLTKIGTSGSVKTITDDPHQPYALWKLFFHSLVGTTSNVALVMTIIWVVYWAVNAVFGTSFSLVLGALMGVGFFVYILRKIRK